MRARSLLPLASAASAAASASQCRTIPSDKEWPSIGNWVMLNKTVAGHLYQNVPLGSVCHDPNYDAEACQELQESWNNPKIHLDSLHSPQQTIWTNWTCDPFTEPSSPCEMGTYPPYTVDAHSHDDVTAGIRFAKDNNLRLVIRNTGSDYHGRSTGAHSLAIGLRHLNSLELLTWNDDHYQGKAIKMGGGVITRDAVVFAESHDLMIVAGNSENVGVAGGFIQGGGYSPLSSKYGLAADNALEFGVILASGDYVVANRKENTDLYWALAGGGGGTFGVVVHATMKAHPNVPLALASLGFSSEGLSEEDFIGIILKWHEVLPDIVKAGGQPLYLVSRQAFQILSLVLPDAQPEDLQALMAPFQAHLAKHEVMYEKFVHPFKSFGHMFERTSGGGNNHDASTMYGGMWFVPQEAAASREFVEALFAHEDVGGLGLVRGFDVSIEGKDVDNSVHKGWREMVAVPDIVFPWSNEYGALEEAAMREVMLSYIFPRFEALAPNGGSHVNEAFPHLDNWKTALFGENYDRLLQIKQKYDPEGIFWGINNVGSDAWFEKEDGRLCRSSGQPGGKDEL